MWAEPVRAEETVGTETSPAELEIEALPAVVKLRTAALLLSDQQGGELAMVSSVVRRPGDKKSLDALLTVEIDDSSLRDALPEGGLVEAYIYLVDRRLEIFDSVSAAWTLSGPPGRPVVEEPAVDETAETNSDPAAPAVSPEAEPTAEPADSDAVTEEINPESEPESAESESENPESEDQATGLDPVRFTAVFPAPPAGDYVFRILFRAGEHFGLRSVPLAIPVANDSVASMLEPVLELPPPENDRWLRVSPAGRGPAGNPVQPGLSIVRPGSRVPLTFARSSKSDVGEVRLELTRDGEARVVPVTSSRSAKGVIRGQVDIPADLEVGSYQLRLLADSARPSQTTEVLVLDESVFNGTAPSIRWTELDRLTSQETTFSGEALRMPASERERVIATRRELFQVVADMEGGMETALARFRALEQSLDEQLGTETIPFLEAQLSKVVSRLMRSTRKQPELTVGLAWLFMEHAEQHRRDGSYRFSRLGQDMSLEILRKLGEDSNGRTWAAEGLAIFGGWLQRQRFLDPAELVLKESLALEPEAPFALSSLAAIYERYDRVKDAVEVLEKLVDVEPDRPLGRVRLAVALHRMGELERADQGLDQVIQAAAKEGDGASKPWWLALAFQEKVRLAVDRGQIKQAQQALNEGLLVFPEDPVLRFAQPWLLSLKGQGDLARQGLLNLASSPDGENARNRFHAWPRTHLDALSRKMRQTTTAASPELAALARKALEKTQ